MHRVLAGAQPILFSGLLEGKRLEKTCNSSKAVATYCFI
jgi:hypothetical protein